MKFGIKLWSTNKDLIIFARKHFLIRDFDYIELNAIKNSFDRTLLSHMDGIPTVIHCDNDEVNFAKKEFYEQNVLAIREAQKFADFLNSNYIIVHPGYGGSIQVLNNLLDEINDNRICVENMPGKTIDLKLNCLGRTYEELQEIKFNNFCLDFAHAIKSAITMKIDIFKNIKELLKLDPVTYHISDGKLNSEVDEHLNLGEGDFDLSLIKGLIQDSSSSMVTFETPRRDMGSFGEDLENIKHFKKISLK